MTKALSEKLKIDYAENPTGLKALVDSMPVYSSITEKIDEENDMKHEITRIEEATSTITEIESDESVILHSTNNFPYSDEYHDEYGYHHGINSGPNVDSKDQQLYAQEESDISPIPAGDPDMVLLELNQDDHIHLTHFESTHTPSIEQVEKVMDNSVKDFSRWKHSLFI